MSALNDGLARALIAPKAVPPVFLHPGQRHHQHRQGRGPQVKEGKRERKHHRANAQGEWNDSKRSHHQIRRQGLVLELSPHDAEVSLRLYLVSSSY